MVEHDNKPVPLTVAARLSRVPSRWLREEAEAGRMPHLKAGTVLLFDPAEVERVIRERLQEAARREAARA